MSSKIEEKLDELSRKSYEDKSLIFFKRMISFIDTAVIDSFSRQSPTEQSKVLMQNLLQLRDVMQATVNVEVTTKQNIDLFRQIIKPDDETNKKKSLEDGSKEIE
tara:strand:- start:64 stop:378 length:315 start_codon:yes stop_codon:yes gene_type:complete